jgi:hypothetical protein
MEREPRTAVLDEIIKSLIVITNTRWFHSKMAVVLLRI